jgi:pimeloyl-ACP methyl ester carboxylesterase
MSDRERLAHEIEGEGETLVFLNGGMMTLRSWEPIVGPFRGRFRILRFDFRGQLMSPGRPSRDFSGHVDDVVRLLDHLEIERAHLVGASFGGEVATLLAALHPERAASLIAITVSDVSTPELREGSERIRKVCKEILEGSDGGRLHDLLVEEVFSEEWVERHRDELAARRKQIALLPRGWFEGVRDMVDCLDRFDLRPHLERIACPTLVVIAGQDRIMPRARSLALAEGIARAEVALFEESGHALVAEDPDRLAGRCVAFLDRLESTGGRT